MSTAVGARPPLDEQRARLLAVGPLPARILIISDAWKPQVNGVVRTLETISEALRALGHTVDVIGPDRFRTLPCPTYPDIRLSLFPRRRLNRLIETFTPDALHIATEGPLGLAARAWAKKRGCAFTTAFHTRFPEYVQARTGLPTVRVPVLSSTIASRCASRSSASPPLKSTPSCAPRPTATAHCNTG